MNGEPEDLGGGGLLGWGWTARRRRPRSGARPATSGAAAGVESGSVLVVRLRADQGFPLGEHPTGSPRPGRRRPSPAGGTSSAAEARSEAWRVRVSDATALAATAEDATAAVRDARVAPGAFRP